MFSLGDLSGLRDKNGSNDNKRKKQKCEARSAGDVYTAARAQKHWAAAAALLAVSEEENAQMEKAKPAAPTLTANNAVQQGLSRRPAFSSTYNVHHHS